MVRNGIKTRRRPEFVDLRDELLQFAVTVEPSRTIRPDLFASTGSEDVVSVRETLSNCYGLGYGLDDPPVAAMGSSSPLAQLRCNSGCAVEGGERAFLILKSSESRIIVRAAQNT